MELPIKHKRGATVPTANDLVVGEIAINTATGLCYTKTGAGNVVAIGLDVAANWGNIGGTLSSQTDLQNALDNKYDASNPYSYIQEANVDGNLYGRKDGLWELVPTGNNIADYDTFAYYDVGSQVYFQGKLYRLASATPYAGIDPTHTAYWESLSGSNPDLSGYALKSGATFTGKVNMAAPTAGGASLNLGVGTSPTTTVAGDVWIATNLNFKDSVGTQKIVANTSTQNTFSQPQIIATTTAATLPALRITNMANATTAHSLVVEDGTNPDISSFIVNNVGSVGIGVEPATWTASTSRKLDVIGNVFVTGQQTVTGNMAITSAASSPALQITHTGTGHSLLVEDAASPDATAFVVNNSGSVGIGVTPATWTPTQKLEVVGYATADTAPTNDNSTKLATTAYVRSNVDATVSTVWSYTAGLVIENTLRPNNIVRLAGNTDLPLGVTAAPITIRVDATSNIAIGTQYVFLQIEYDPFEFVPEAGVGLYSLDSKKRTGGYQTVCTLIKSGPNEWFLAGNLA